MAKRIVAGVLCAIMLLSLVFMAVRAEEMSEAERIGAEAVEIYQKCLVSTEMESLAGYCGLMTSHQLFHMGVNKYLYVNDGNKQFDYYRDLEITNGGYYPRALSAEQGDLVWALNEISRYGTRDVYDILVGFQWTDTEAGGIFGHACVINAILDGVVYYVEGFYTPYAGEGGNLGRCSIEEFVSQFSSWTIYEGIIHFTRDYAESCESYGTDLLIRSRFAATLRSQPCTPGDHGCEVLRTAAAGEVLRATGVYRNREGEFFYRVEEEGQTAYVYANATSLVKVNATDLFVEELELPEHILTGQQASFAGTVRAANGLIGNLQVKLTGADGQVVADEQRIVDGISCQIRDLQPDTTKINPGNYLAEVWGYTASACVENGELSYIYAPRMLGSRMLTVGLLQRLVARMPEAAVEEKPAEGWNVRDGQIYYYQEGKMVTGWLREMGVSYYFTESGAAARGEVELDGEVYRFTQTGALMEEPEKTEKTEVKTAVS